MEGKEKKTIKISLYSFYVLCSGIVIILAALLLAGFMIFGNGRTVTRAVTEPENKNSVNNSVDMEALTKKYIEIFEDAKNYLENTTAMDNLK